MGLFLCLMTLAIIPSCSLRGDEFSPLVTHFSSIFTIKSLQAVGYQPDGCGETPNESTPDRCGGHYILTQIPAKRLYKWTGNNCCVLTALLSASRSVKIPCSHNTRLLKASLVKLDSYYLRKRTFVRVTFIVP